MFGAFTLVFFVALFGLARPFYALKRKHFGGLAAAAFIMMMVTVPEPEEGSSKAAAPAAPPKDYVQVEKDNAPQIAALKKEVADVPATNIDENLRIYSRLVELAPGNADFIKKKNDFDAKALRRERWNEEPEEALEIADWHWSSGGFGSIMIIDRMKITNAAPFAIKDFVVKCTHQGPSGTDMDSNTRRVYDVIPANGSKTVREINMGFINSQATTSRCEITDADLA